MTVTRPKASIVLSAIFGLLALNAVSQAVQVALGKSTDPVALIALQLGIGLTGALTAWGAWRGASWTWLGALGYGVVTASMLFALPSLLDLEAEARSGIWSGATAVLLFGVGCAWYFRRGAQRRGVA